MRNLDLGRWPLPFPSAVFNAADTGAGAAAAAAADKTVTPPAAGEDAAAAAAAAAAGRAAPVKPAGADGAVGDGVQAPADYPADWREKMATGADGKVDAKKLEQLKRFTSPVDLGASWFDAQGKIRSGKAGEDVPMPDAATDPEGNKKWREERGIPLDATGYKLPEPLEAKLAPEDKPILASYTEFAAKKGLSPAEVARGVEWYSEMADAQAEETNRLDAEQKDATETALMKEWGAEYKPMKTIANRYAAEVLGGADLMFARLPNRPEFGENAGKMVGNIPALVKSLANLGKAQYGDVSFAGGEAAKQSEARITELEKIMHTDIDKWNASPDLRKEHFDLISARDKSKGTGT